MRREKAGRIHDLIESSPSGSRSEGSNGLNAMDRRQIGGTEGIFVGLEFNGIGPRFAQYFVPILEAGTQFDDIFEAGNKLG